MKKQIRSIRTPARWTPEKDNAQFQEIFGDTEVDPLEFLFQRVFEDQRTLRVMLALSIQCLNRSHVNVGYWPYRSLAADELLEIAHGLIAKRAANQKQFALVEQLFVELRFVFSETSRLCKARVSSSASPVTLFEARLLTDLLYSAGHDLNSVLFEIIESEWTDWIICGAADEWCIPATELHSLHSVTATAPLPLFWEFRRLSGAA